MWRWRRRSDEDFDQEIQAHIGLDTDQRIAEGLSPAEARATALRAFGNVTLAQERFYESRRIGWLDDLGRDVRYASRSFVRNPGFTAVAVLTLALGIGANTAIFSVVNAILLRPLPYKNADRLIQVMENRSASDRMDGGRTQIPAAMEVDELALFRASTRTLSEVGTYTSASLSLMRSNETIRLAGTKISADVFPMLGAEPVLGRTFESRDENPGSEFVVILSYGAWQRYFGGAPNILDQRLTMDGAAYQVVGVMAPGFQFPDSFTEFWIPLTLKITPDVTSRYAVYGRLREDVSLANASAEISSVIEHLRHPLTLGSRLPPGSPPPFEVIRRQDRLVEPVRPGLRILLAAVACVLLIACVNVANLVLARMSARQGELAVRRALGAGRARLFRQVLAENAVLALFGGAGGTVLAVVGIRLLKILGSTVSRIDLEPGLTLPRLSEVGVDGVVLAYTLVISVGSGLLFGLVPALRQSRAVLPRRQWHGLLIVTQIALAMMLLVSGGLMIRSFVKLSHVDPGFDPTNVLTFQVSLPLAASSDQHVMTFSEALAARIRSVPGVRHVGYTQTLPMLRLVGGVPLRRQADAPMPSGWLSPDASRPPDVPQAHLVSPDFLDAIGVRLVEGRGFSDRRGPLPSILVNQTLARSGFLGDRPVGSQIYAGRTLVEVIGVVQDIHTRNLERAPDPQIFSEYSPDYNGPRLVQPWTGLGPYFAVRTDRRPTSSIVTIRNLVRQLDPGGTIDHVATMEDLVSTSMARPRLYAGLLGLFAAVAIALASVGIYGVTAYAVAQRTREIGIRMALGSQSAGVLGLVIRQGAVLTCSGIVLGLVAASIATRSLQGMLFSLTPLDPTTFAVVTVLFVAVATLASYVPARRATKVDPLVALRCE